ncbi:MAG TPA: hypothetical protein VFA34_03615, partial [Actinomycetota bacterium]|nr:hypothetical protein [Actinomycetota bacterium]
MSDLRKSLAEALGNAAALISELDLPETLQSVAFAKTLDVFFADSMPAVRPHGLVAGPVSLTSSDAPEHAGPLDRIAERAGVETNLILQIYRMDDDRLSVVVGSRRIPSEKAQGARKLTLLVAGGRQAAGLEDWTPLSAAREVCKHYNRLDTANYSTTIRDMDDVFA